MTKGRFSYNIFSTKPLRKKKNQMLKYIINADS